MNGNLITVRVGGEVGAGKTHVLETIRKALEAEYGGEIDISLTDIKHDKAVGNSTAPASTVTFKLIEDVTRK